MFPRVESDVLIFIGSFLFHSDGASLTSAPAACCPSKFAEAKMTELIVAEKVGRDCSRVYARRKGVLQTKILESIVAESVWLERSIA